MKILQIDFDEVYRRHLCRHGEFGINVLHAIAVVVIYLALVALAGKLVGLITDRFRLMTVSVLLIPWLFVLVLNVPFRVWVATVLTMTGVVAAWWILPPIPFWAWLLVIVAMHQFQQWSHRVYRLHRDMSEFSGKYRKGFRLFLMLSIFELPILLNYLVFRRVDWLPRGGSEQPV